MSNVVFFNQAYTVYALFLHLALPTVFSVLGKLHVCLFRGFVVASAEAINGFGFNI